MDVDCGANVISYAMHSYHPFTYCSSQHIIHQALIKVLSMLKAYVLPVVAVVELAGCDVLSAGVVAVVVHLL